MFCVCKLSGGFSGFVFLGGFVSFLGVGPRNGPRRSKKWSKAVCQRQLHCECLVFFKNIVVFIDFCFLFLSNVFLVVFLDLYFLVVS